MSSAISLFGCSRLGSSIAVLDHVHLGSTLSLRSSSRLGGSLRANGVHFSQGINALENAQGDLVFTVQGNKTMTLTSTGGMLHGTWSSEQMVTASDARLKTGIMPVRSFAARRKRHSMQPFRAGRLRKGPLTSLLMGLRPVAYRYRHSKQRLRFGFLTQDLEQHLPEVVAQLPFTQEAEVDDKGETRMPLKGIMYQDLIAVLAAASQEQQLRIESLEREVVRLQQLGGLREELAGFGARLAVLERRFGASA